VIPRNASAVPPLYVAGPAERSSHYSAVTNRYAAKIPATVSGRRPVTVRVPPRLIDRVRLIYSDSGLATETTFTPCASRKATFFPGGLVFRGREPISLLVEIEGVIRPLRLGVIESRN
jgi:hypothetical protein